MVSLHDSSRPYLKSPLSYIAILNWLLVQNKTDTIKTKQEKCEREFKRALALGTHGLMVESDVLNWPLAKIQKSYIV